MPRPASPGTTAFFVALVALAEEALAGAAALEPPGLDSACSPDESNLALRRRCQELGCCEYVLIHPGKTGGTSIKHYLGRHNLTSIVPIGGYGHEQVLGRLEPCSCYFTFLRDPAERWVSSFLSRLRKGCPRHCREWTEKERRVFSAFRTPTALAEALSSPNATLCRRAHAALYDVRHLREGYAFHFRGLREWLPRFAFVGVTCRLRADARRLLHAVGVPADVVDALPAIGREHRMPREFEQLRALSDLARSNLEHLLRDEYEMMDGFFRSGFIPSSDLRRVCAG